MTPEPDATAWVFAPSPLLTVTVEPSDHNGSEIHIHAGGQGYWLGRLLRRMGLQVVLSASFGGETGRILRGLLAEEGFDLRTVTAAAPNGAYIHDRRSGERTEMATMDAGSLSRHEADDLYGASLVAGLDAAVCVLGGPPGASVVIPDLYRRLAGDLRANGKTVVADLSGELAEAVLAGGVSLLKLSDEQMAEDRRITGSAVPDLVRAMRDLTESGADAVVVSRGAEATLALLGDRVVQASSPALAPVDTRGAGDSLTAGIAAGLARGTDLETALRIGVAAGALNVARRGLGSGNRVDIERLAERVEIRPVIGSAARRAG